MRCENNKRDSLHKNAELMHQNRNSFLDTFGDLITLYDDSVQVINGTSWVSWRYTCQI